MNILTVNHLTVASQKHKLVKDLSFDIQKREWFALVGQSGSGKSMTGYAIGQLLAPNLRASGEVKFAGSNLLSLSASAMRSIRGKQLSYIFQDYQGSFTPFHTIGHHFEEYQQRHTELNAKERQQQAQQALLSVGLSEVLYTRYPFQLSGGQLQRVSIAIALLLKPDLLIADEPTTALDSVTSYRILELLARLQGETGCAILFITHDLRHVRKYADRIAVMKDGTLVETGSKEQVLNQPQHPYTKLLIQSSPSFRAKRPLATEAVAE